MQERTWSLGGSILVIWGKPQETVAETLVPKQLATLLLTPGMAKHFSSSCHVVCAEVASLSASGFCAMSFT